MFQFPGFASSTYEFSAGSPSWEGFPHSDIRGSTIARISPRLFAACHVLHRLLAPRHPPNALLSLYLSRHRPRAEPRRTGQVTSVTEALAQSLTLIHSITCSLRHVVSRRRAPPASLAAACLCVLAFARRARSYSPCERSPLPRPALRLTAFSRRRGIARARFEPCGVSLFTPVRHRPRSLRPRAWLAHPAGAGRPRAVASCPLPCPYGGDRVRTDDPLLAKQALSQLSYAPAISCRAGLHQALALSRSHGPEHGPGRT